MIQQSALHKPSRLEQAQSRLETAIAKLEANAAATSLAPIRTEAVDQHARDLEQEIVTLRDRNRTLDETNVRVGERLDDVIHRLKSAVEA